MSWLIGSRDESNNTAKRKVVKHSRLVGLIKKGGCKVEYKSKGNTKHTVLGMRKFVKKHQHQTKLVAKQLLGENLENTISNNYGFLYTHFQYEADARLQKMRSPQCSVSDRFKGIDCKSYSILTSTILLNQNIKHVIRRIKQPDLSPDYWTHVYVVIPINQTTGDLKQGYYVIDGTLHINKEPLYIEKDDIIMENNSDLPHVWLNGAVNTTTSASLNANAASEGFKKYLELLLVLGVDNTKVAAIQQTLNSYLSKGIDPSLKITNLGITIQGNYISYTDGSETFSKSKQGFTNAIRYVNTLSDYPVSTSFQKDGLDSEQIEGLTEVLGSALGGNFFGNTFGAVFSNGMELSCWNSTFTPSQTSQQVNTVHIPFVNGLFNKIHAATSEGALKAALDDFDKTIANHNKFFWNERDQPHWKRCSRLGLDVYTEYYRALYPKIPLLVSALSGKFNITSTELSAKTVIPTIYDKQSGPAGRTYTYKVYTVSLKDGVIVTNPNPDEGTNAGGGSGTGGNTNNGGGSNSDNGTGTGSGSGSGGNNGDGEQKAGYGTVLGVGLAALAIGALAMNNKSITSKNTDK